MSNKSSSSCGSFASDSSECDYEFVHYDGYGTITQQDLANVHFRFEEEEEYLSDYQNEAEEGSSPFVTHALSAAEALMPYKEITGGFYVQHCKKQESWETVWWDSEKILWRGTLH